MSEFTTKDNRLVDLTIDDVPDDIQDIRLVDLPHIEILEAGNISRRILGLHSPGRYHRRAQYNLVNYLYSIRVAITGIR